MGAPSLPVIVTGRGEGGGVHGLGPVGRRVGFLRRLCGNRVRLDGPGAGVAGTGSVATARSWLRAHPDNTSPSTTMGTSRRTPMLVSLPRFTAQRTTPAHAGQIDQGTEMEADKARVTVGTPWHERGIPCASRERGTTSRSPQVVLWRRRELNPGPKTVSTTDLHV